MYLYRAERIERKFIVLFILVVRLRNKPAGLRALDELGNRSHNSPSNIPKARSINRQATANVKEVLRGLR